ncbi:alpha/beta hydrolase-fold protein [Flavobacterium sp. GCM10027622]|uniref:alpha/beta hydrolase-fold protein n=1 Tax=unclassified Flavobacterium TaxID=196869 RepID=UPI00360FFD14
MKIILQLVVLLSLRCYAQGPNQNTTTIPLGTIETITSTVLKEKRELLVYLPASASAGSTNRYPVMYLLDGHSFFHSATGMMQYLSAIGKMPEMIVVAVVNTDRVRDLTPTHSISWSDGEENPNFLKNSGGGEAFISFLEKELIPYIDAKYKTEPYRMLVGHSLGGLLVIHTLLNHTELFHSYVAIDPSLWWDKQFLVQQVAQVLEQKECNGKSLFFAAANTKEKGTLVDEKNQASINVPAKDKILFHELLQKNKKTKLAWHWKFYEEDNHASVPLLSMYDAFRYLFKNYELDKEVSDTTITVEYIQNHYQKLSASLQYTLLPAQSTMNQLGYNFMASKHYDQAYSFFKMNIDNYPTSSNAYDSMGDYYLEIKDTKKAIAAFEKALSLKEVSDTRRKLEQLKATK